MTRLRRLRHHPITRAKISAALTGRKQSPEHVAARAAALTGKPKSEAHRAAISKARRSPTPEDIAERREELIRERKAAQKADKAARETRWRLDILTAQRLGDAELVRDIAQSRGYRARRKIFHPEVSDGWAKETPSA